MTELTAHYTADQITYLFASVIDKHFKGKPVDNAKYNKPTLAKMEAKAKTYGAIREFYDVAVKFRHNNGGTNDSLQGIGATTKLKFANRNNAVRAKMAHRKMHIGITYTEDELERNGIFVNDGFRRPEGSMSSVDPRLFNIAQDKAYDLEESAAESKNRLLWGDGTADPLAMQGILARIKDNPLTGIVCGIDIGAVPEFRNFARTSAAGAAGGNGAITSSTTGGGELLRVLHEDDRTLTIYGPQPDLFPCGHDFLSAAEKEFRANGQYSQTGFSRGGEAGVGSLMIHGVAMYHEPELDLIGRSKYGYRISSEDLCLYHQEGMWGKVRNPARPYDELVVHKSLLFSGNTLATRLRNQAVYQIN